MAWKSSRFGLTAIIVAATLGTAAPASAEFFGCDDQHHAARTVSFHSASTHSASSSSTHRAQSYIHRVRYTHEFAAQSRPRITVRPRRTTPGPNAKRYCRSWLAKEYRVSGPVIVPQMQCWWR
jgi:hypothetical protein